MESQSLNHSHYLVPILPEDVEIYRDMSQIPCFFILKHQLKSWTVCESLVCASP